MTTAPPNPYDVELALAAALAQVTQSQDTAITQAWAKAWGSVSIELLDSLTEVLTDAGRMSFSAVVRYQRLNTMLGQVANHLDDLAQGLGITITNDLNDVVHSAEVGTRELIAAQRLLHDERRGLPVRRVPSPAMQAIVRRTTEQVTSQLQPLADETYATVLRELTKGVAAGDNPRTTARQMVSKAEDMHNFGRARALNIARTETLDAYRAGAQETEKQYPDVLTGWAWAAHLGPRTCRSCLSMHGRVFDLDVPGPDDHPQGRCSRIPVVREDDGSVDLSWMPDADDHFAALSEEDQRAILGNAGYDAWKRGEFPRDQWTKRQTNDGWRDSQIPARPGDSTAGTIGAGAQDLPGSDSGHAPPPAAPSGGPGGPDEPHSIGEHLVIVDHEVTDTLDAAVRSIDNVHLVPADMAEVNAELMTAARVQSHPNTLGVYHHIPGRAPTLELRPPAGSAQQQFVAIHELGHALDDLIFGDHQSNLTNGTRTNLDGELAPWWDAVQASETYQQLGEMAAWDAAIDGHWVTITTPDGREVGWSPDNDHLQYLMRPTEVFARAYSQWVVQAGGTPSQQFAVEAGVPRIPPGFTVFPAGRTPNYPDQWSTADFTAIAEQLRLLFEGRGLTPGGNQ